MFSIPPRVKLAALSVAAGAVGILIVGFSTDMIFTAGETRDRTAAAELNGAVVALTPFCVEKAQADPNYATKLAEMKAERTYGRDDIVEDAGWATFNGSDKPNLMVADMCVDRLMEEPEALAQS